jgi:hypothetical protein
MNVLVISYIGILFRAFLTYQELITEVHALPTLIIANNPNSFKTHLMGKETEAYRVK